MANDTILSVRNLSIGFGGIWALQDVSFDVRRTEIVALIGPNGAGKTSLFNAVSRIYRPAKGEILINEEPLLRMRPESIVRAGVGRTFQHPALFPSMTVRENLLLGGYSLCKGYGLVGDLIRLPGSAAREAALKERVDKQIVEYGLELLAEDRVEGLPYGVLKRIELARAMMPSPRLLLLDEPAGGLTAEDIEDLKRTLRRVRDTENVTVLIVEHNMPFVVDVADRAVALNAGRKIAEGVPQDVIRDPGVVEAYLGRGTQ